MTVTPTPKPVYPLSDQVAALAIVVLLSGVMGAILGMLPGYKFPRFWKFPGYETPVIMKAVTLPPLLGMIFMGFISRNFFGPLMNAYPAPWTPWMRSICLNVILIRGGFGVSFRGKGLLVLLLSTVPQLVEAVIAAAISLPLFKMPMEVSFALPFSYVGVGAAIIIPGVVALNEKGYGRSKGIASTLTACSVFDPIICIISFGICKAISF